uniref:Uncharacterized protein n=1 Tax=Anguilla anguilla TaxID=7936 RepID=A0A0E9TR25_ANGAN
MKENILKAFNRSGISADIKLKNRPQGLHQDVMVKTSCLKPA